MRMPRGVRIGLAATATVGFGVAGWWAVRVAIADYWFQKETTAATEKAIELTPGQSAYDTRLALLAGDEDPAKAVKALRKAVELNPSDGRAWVELGLRLEETGDQAGAEQALLRAADEDKMYLPRWTLTNYYFRHGQTDRFWVWAKAAVPMINGDPLPLFHLCGRVEEDGGLIDRLEIRKPELQAAYLFYLLDVGRADLVGPASRRLLEAKREGDVPLLLNACDRLIEARRVDDAVTIWEALERSGRLPFRAGAVLTNGDFGVSPTGHGFDWRLPALEGISAAREEGPTGLRLTFSGEQAERVEPLVEFVPVREKTTYELRFTYRTSGIAGRSGLAWEAGDGSTVLKDGDDLASDAESEGRLTFATPAGCRMVRLSMVCQRRPGTTRIAGYVVLRNVELRASSARAATDSH
jgi:hypothetical protein